MDYEPLSPDEVEDLKFGRRQQEACYKDVEHLRTGEHKDLMEPEDFYRHFLNNLPVRVIPHPSR